MSQNDRPLPVPTYYSQEYWDGCRRQELRMQRCTRCDHIRFYPSPVCPRCTSFEFAWTRLSGRGKVVSYTAIHRAPSPFFADKVPYMLLLVKLDEGPVMMANLVNSPHKAVAIDMSVRVVFEQIGDDLWLPQFEADSAAVAVS